MKIVKEKRKTVTKIEKRKNVSWYVISGNVTLWEFNSKNLLFCFCHHIEV